MLTRAVHPIAVIFSPCPQTRFCAGIVCLKKMDSPRSLDTENASTAPRARARSGLALFAGAALVALVTDQLSKVWIRSHLAPGAALPLVPNWIHLEHVQNHGAAWGVLAGHKWLLIVFTVAVTALVLSSAREVASRGAAAAIGFGLILGGALGNLFDRAAFGYVTDFFDVDTSVAWLRTFPVFNVADSALSVGVVLMLLSLMLGPREKAA